MTADDHNMMTSYELPLSGEAPSSVESPRAFTGLSLPESILARNVPWFCRLRWAVIAILIAFGVLGRSDEIVRRLALRPPGVWPFVLAGVLVICNLAYLAHAHSLRSSRKKGRSAINLWAQIVLDLLVLTMVVHFFGSIRTYIPFAYLFHIVLACVFFSRQQSLVVVLIACGLFAMLITAERLGLIQSVSIFTDEQFGHGDTLQIGVYALNFVSATCIWLSVWYLVSHLSTRVRVRDLELAQTNARLVAVQEERSRHMLTTTHQLKAPFAAIHANAQLLLKGHCGELPDEARKVALRIATRSRRLALEIQEMLQLANLSSSGQKPHERVELDLAELLDWCIKQVQVRAVEHGVIIDAEIEPARTMGVEDHLKMVFGNLLSNAVLYSHEGGCVRVKCRPQQYHTIVTISDEGIGIPAEKLPHIFEEHYRTKEAVKHNKDSSGLGLAIVKNVVELHKIRMQVQSQPGMGTTFTLWFPSAETAPPVPEQKEI